jgi:hypothetical protein
MVLLVAAPAAALLLCSMLSHAAATTSLPLWTRGSYARLSIDASDFSASFAFGPVSMTARPPLGTGSNVTQQRSGVDASLGAFDEIAMGLYSVRYYKKLDAFEFQRSYHPLLSTQFAAATATAAAAAAAAAAPAAPAAAVGHSCVDLSGIYRAPGTGIGTGPGGVDVVSTISQKAGSCFFTVGGESLCNGANATVNGSTINGTGGCLLGKRGAKNATVCTIYIYKRSVHTLYINDHITKTGSGQT